MGVVRSVALVGFFLGCAAGCAPRRGTAYEASFAAAQRDYHAGRFAEAADAYAAAAKQAKVPRDGAFARYESALARERSGDLATASRELRAIAADKGGYAAPAAYRAADLTARTDEAAGLAEIEEVAFRFPESGIARAALERVIHHDDTQGPEKALAHLEAMTKRATGTALAGTIAYERARRLDELGRNAEARDGYVDVANRWPYPFGPYFDDALFRASEMEEKLERPREAIAHLERLLSYRETSDLVGSYERPRYVPAALRIASLYEEKLHDRGAAREALHRIYRDFKHTTMRDDALWREAELFRKDGNKNESCDRLASLSNDFPDSRYVPCAVDRCPTIKRAAKSKAPRSCHAYLLRESPSTP